LIFTTSIAACGGGGGGSAILPSNPDSSIVDDPAAPVGNPVVINAGVIAGPCNANLEDVLDLALDSVTLPDLGPGCDYFVEDFESTSANLTVDAGVAFLMGDGAGLSMRGTTVAMNGTASQPIIFQGVDNVAGAWEGLDINGPNGSFNTASLNYVFVSGAAGTGRKMAALDVTSADLSLTNSTITASSNHAVFVEGFDGLITNFQSNTFTGNQGHPLVLSTIGLAAGLDASSDFIGAGNPNNRSEVLVEPTSSSSETIRDAVIIKDIGTPYLFRNSLTVGDGGLILGEGVDIRFAPDQGLATTSALYAFGEPGNPVTFGLEQGASGDWKGLTLGGISVMDHFQIIGGGSGQGSSGGSVTLPNVTLGSAQNAIVRLSNGSINSSQGFGIFCTSSFDLDLREATLLDVSFQDSLASDIHPACVGLQSIAAVEAPPVGNNPSPLTISNPLGQCRQVLIGENIRDPAIFSNETNDCDVYVLGDVRFSSTVFIEEGTVFIMGPEASVHFGGTLTANGSDQNTIKFLGENDVAGDWQGITIGEAAASRFSFVDIYNAGVFSPAVARRTLNPNQNGAALTLTGSAPEGQGMQVSEVTVSRSAGHGVYLDDRLSGLASFSNNVFLDIALPDLAIHAEHVGLLDDTNVYSSSLETVSEPIIEIKSDSSQRPGFRFDGSETLKPLGGPWLIPDTAFIANSDTLTVEAGTELVFGETGRLTVTGDLQVMGTEAMPVVFTGQEETALRWGGVEITGSATIAQAILQGGGMAERGGPSFGNGLSVGITSALEGTIQISFPDTPILISDVTIKDSYGFAIKCAGTNAGNFLLTRPTFSNNQSGDVDPDCGI